jgi:DNA-binding NarL/FixJ family response regulator
MTAGARLYNDSAILPPSGRQSEVWALVAQGLHNGEIAARLGIEVSTVKVHLGEIFKRAHCRNRVEAALRWHRLPVGPA